MRKFIFVVGTTASGKSELALRLAQNFSLPILNADSIQVFKKLDIGAAKPSVEEMKLVPHYLFNLVEPDQKYNVSDYAVDVSKVLTEKKIDKAIFCGGSGFYLRALESGIYPANTVNHDAKLEASKIINEKGAQLAWEYLNSLDPIAAKKFHFNDIYRLTRALEIYFSQGKTKSSLDLNLKSEGKGILKPEEINKIAFFWTRDQLRERVKVRTKKMLSLGLIEEVRELQSLGLADAKPLQSVGYFETLKYLKGECSASELEDLIIQGTMQLAKKQMTWFKKDKTILWLNVEQIEAVVQKLSAWLES